MREQIGRILGYAILGNVLGLIIWTLSSFIMWDTNPGNWPLEMRVVAVVLWAAGYFAVTRPDKS